jgi:hypothetical protein
VPQAYSTTGIKKEALYSYGSNLSTERCAGKIIQQRTESKFLAPRYEPGVARDAAEISARYEKVTLFPQVRPDD